ncbi:hypothetical protein ACFY0R_02385 [Streptomyces sp. NPDC001633]
MVAQYTERMRTLADTLLEAMASALRQPADSRSDPRIMSRVTAGSRQP